MVWGNGVAVLICCALLPFVFKWLWVKLCRGASQKSSESSSKGLMVVLGSGGHTAEMIKLLHSMDLKDRFAPRCYVVADTDSMSEGKARRFEGDGHLDDFVIDHIPRSREVGQKYFTSVITTLRALLSASVLAMHHRPRVLLVNGPGTCLPIVLCCKFLCRCRVVYIESIARVNKLSLTGKILYGTRLADIFYVQWEELQQKLPRAKCVGRVY